MNNKIFKDKNVEQILKDYNFTHMFYVKFAYMCAEFAVKQTSRPPHPDTIKCLELVKRFIAKDKSLTSDMLKTGAHAAAYCVANAAYAAYSAHSAAHSAATAAHSAGNAVNAAYFVDTANSKSLLLDFINSELTEFEKIMIFGEDYK